MEVEFPIYPFIWNYDDMYDQLNYEIRDATSLLGY